MKREQRSPYLAIVGEIDWILCSFCKNAEWHGTCAEAEPECCLPIAAIEDIALFIDPTTDCWGFKPLLNISDLADIAGMVMTMFVPDTVSWGKERDGTIRVQGKFREAPDGG